MVKTWAQWAQGHLCPPEGCRGPDLEGVDLCSSGERAAGHQSQGKDRKAPLAGTAGSCGSVESEDGRKQVWLQPPPE